MHKRPLLLCLVLLLVSTLSNVAAQTPGGLDIVYLQNGKIIKGEFLRIKQSGLKVRTEGRNIIKLPLSEVDSVVKEGPTNSAIQATFNGPEKRIRFTNITELGYTRGKGKQEIQGNGRNIPEVFASTSRLQTVNGLQFTQGLTVGLGVGIDFYMESEDFALPIFIDARKTFLPGPIAPEALMAVGYTIDPKNGYKGAFGSGGLGLKIHMYNNTALHISLHYRRQKFSNTEEYYSNSLRNVKVENYYRQGEFRVGFSF